MFVFVCYFFVLFCFCLFVWFLKLLFIFFRGRVFCLVSLLFVCFCFLFDVFGFIYLRKQIVLIFVFKIS